jgi:metal-responsive CopG/Arc/MetJ family transcriptional regulator
MKRHNFFLPEELVAELKAVAIETGVPMSELVRRALQNWLAERKAKVAA